jgi:hypothetical protein
MPRFTPLQTEGDEGLAAAEAWLRAYLEQSCANRRVNAVVDWIIETGRREAGPTGGPQLAQLGYRIHLVERATGERGTLSCFIAADDIQDEEQRLVVEQVLALWLDRAIDTD